MKEMSPKLYQITALMFNQLRILLIINTTKLNPVIMHCHLEI